MPGKRRLEMTCEFCGNDIRPCSRFCKHSGFTHTETELHLCEPRHLWAWYSGYAQTYYAYPIGILRASKVRLHSDNSRNVS